MIVLKDEPCAATLSTCYVRKRYAESFLLRNSKNIKQVLTKGVMHDHGRESEKVLQRTKMIHTDGEGGPKGFVF